MGGFIRYIYSCEDFEGVVAYKPYRAYESLSCGRTVIWGEINEDEVRTLIFVDMDEDADEPTYPYSWLPPKESNDSIGMLIRMNWQEVLS